ncbi:putative outer membrane protein [Parvularcula bermudensis HTCC2503]|uniref:Putative outer membrane protein n=1 Tax=Parvularcula bermudensis (strain ATCC BAA-594 / HTCC2503 / KCTC 12087) TaxID=314260 RepID=E0TIE5_PARBH|nr:TolC family protein [Parvularcula bermudensis]ADM10264.1 putative outer membrane protein [Parvularcula bermudensis HTCC2503]
MPRRFVVSLLAVTAAGFAVNVAAGESVSDSFDDNARTSIGSAPSPLNANCLGVSSAIALAVSADPRIDRAEANRLFAEAEMKAARSRYYPQISAFGTTGLGDTPPLDRRRDDQIGIQLNQELYSFGARRAASDAARLKAEAAAIGVDGTMNDIALGAARAYIEFARAQALQSISKSAEGIISQDVEAADLRLRRRAITITAASEIRARFARQLSELVTAESRSEANRARLSVLIDQPIDCIDPQTVPDFVLPGIDDVLDLSADEAVSLATSRSPNLQSAETAIEAARAEVKAAKRAALPTLSLNGFAVHFSDVEVDFFGETTDTAEEDVRLGFSLTQDLYTGGRLKAQQQSAIARLKQAQSEARLERWSLEDAVRSSLGRATAQRRAVRELQRAEEEVRRQLALTEREYNLGTKTLTDLVRVTEIYAEIAAFKVNAVYDYYTVLFDLYAAMGVLDYPDRLETIIR